MALTPGQTRGESQCCSAHRRWPARRRRAWWATTAPYLPALENALIAGHDIIFLGERGQAKTRLMRSLVELLDEQLPIVAGSEILDDPYHPISRYGRELVATKGDSCPVEWVGREQRFGEKLATPDTSIADLIGEVDPVKVAEGRYLSDELTLHYGLVPRTNRGIFAINELPDLAERIQVGLLNVLEERDVQVRGYKIRLPLDVMLVASANPEDYTSRGRIITPLKDRFGAQIRTHYPLDTPTEVAVILQEADPADLEDVKVEVPAYMAEVVASISQLARQSPQVNQRSGVSVRLGVANYETLVAAALATCSAARRSRKPYLESATWQRSSRRPPGRWSWTPWTRRAKRTSSAASPARQCWACSGRTSSRPSSLRPFPSSTTAQPLKWVTTCLRLPTSRRWRATQGCGHQLASSRAPKVQRLWPPLRSCVLEGLHLAKRLNKHPTARGASYQARRS